MFWLECKNKRLILKAVLKMEKDKGCITITFRREILYKIKDLF